MFAGRAVLAVFWGPTRQGVGVVHVIGIGIGSALGGMLRYLVSGWVAHRFGETFPWGTLLVNVSGSFLIGLIFILVGTEGRLRMDPLWRDFVILGILGGYTTFSSFSLQTLNLARDGQWLGALGNVMASVVFCLLAVTMGFWAAKMILEVR